MLHHLRSGHWGDHFFLDSLLAQGFPITAGRVDITVPSGYPARDTYIVARKSTYIWHHILPLVNVVLNLVIGSSGNISPAFTITSGGSTSDTVNSPPPATSTTPARDQPTSVPGTPPSTTPSSGSSTVTDVSSPSPKPSPAASQPHSSASSPSSSVSGSSTPSSGTPGSSNGNTSSSNSGWVNKPAGGLVVSLLVASLVTLFL